MSTEELRDEIYKLIDETTGAESKEALIARIENLLAKIGD